MFQAGEVSVEHAKQVVAAYWGHFKISQQANRFRKILSDFSFFDEILRVEKAKRAALAATQKFSIARYAREQRGREKS